MSETISERAYRIMESAKYGHFRNTRNGKEIFVTGAEHPTGELEYRYVGTKTLRRMNINRFVNTFDRITTGEN